MDACRSVEALTKIRFNPVELIIASVRHHFSSSLEQCRKSAAMRRPCLRGSPTEAALEKLPDRNIDGRGRIARLIRGNSRAE